VDNGDGTYTLKHNAYGDRFSAIFPIVLPDPTESNTVNCSIEVVGGSISMDKIELRTFDANGNALSYFGASEGGRDFGIKGVSAQIYLSSTTKEGDYITFRNPMIKLGVGYIGYKPYIKRTYPIPANVQALAGYGQSNPNDPTEYNYIDFAEKKFVRKGVITNGEWVREAGEIDLSSILPDDNFIAVEGGGMITAVNEHKLAVPAKIIYQLKGVS
jgi:hypothetical protein